MHRTFVATLGVNNTAKLDELFAFLHRNGTEEIIEAEDMDKYSNEMVGKGASKIYALAARHGMRCRRLTWNPNYPRTRNQPKVVFHHIAQIFHRDLILFRDTALAYDLPIAQCTAASLIP